MLGSLGWQELLIILVIIALLFGASRIADMGSAFGKGIREFRTAVKSEDEEEAPKRASISSPAPTKPAPPPAASDPFVDDIVRLTELHDRGVLTDDQFAAAKAKLVAGE